METTKLKRMIKQMERAMTAASFAEEGELDAAQSFLREGRRVLLALKRGQIDAKTLRYAMNTASRINAHLDILYVSSPDADPRDGSDSVLVSFEEELAAEGISYRLVHRSGCLKQHIVDYTDSEKEILFAVIESPAGLDDDCNRRDKELSELWRKLKCPLVVVMDGVKA